MNEVLSVHAKSHQKIAALHIFVNVSLPVDVLQAPLQVGAEALHDQETVVLRIPHVTAICHEFGHTQVTETFFLLELFNLLLLGCSQIEVDLDEQWSVAVRLHLDDKLLGTEFPVRVAERGHVEFSKTTNSNRLPEHPLLLYCVCQHLAPGKGVWEQKAIWRSAVHLSCILCWLLLRLFCFKLDILGFNFHWFRIVTVKFDVFDLVHDVRTTPILT